MKTRPSMLAGQVWCFSFGFGSKDSSGPKVFKLKQPLNFKNNFYTIYECEEEHREGKKYFYALTALNIFCWLNVVKNIYRMRIFRTLLWLLPSGLTYLAQSGFKQHFNQFVLRIDLKDDGKTVKVTFLSGGSQEFTTRDFSPSSQKEFAGNLDKFGMIGV